MIQQDQGFVMSNSVSNHAYPNHLTREIAASTLTYHSLIHISLSHHTHINLSYTYRSLTCDGRSSVVKAHRGSREGEWGLLSESDAQTGEGEEEDD